GLRKIYNPTTMEARGIRLQGERGISRKATAQGMPECSGCTCMLVCASIYILHTRPRVQQAPGIPCALFFWANEFANLGRNAPRDGEVVSNSVTLRSAPLRASRRATATSGAAHPSRLASLAPQDDGSK